MFGLKPETLIFGLIPMTLVYRVLAFVLWSAACALGGYLYKGHVDAVADAATKATQTATNVTTNAAATASDGVQVATLKTQITAATATQAALLRQITELQQHANPTDTACRLPDGLRASINANLTAR